MEVSRGVCYEVFMSGNIKAIETVYPLELRRVRSIDVKGIIVCGKNERDFRELW